MSDIMYQALKAKKYSIFENALNDRKALLNRMNEPSVSFDSLTEETRHAYRLKIEENDQKIEEAMLAYRKDVDDELNMVHAKKARLRKHSNIKNYYHKNIGNQGVFINKLK